MSLNSAELIHSQFALAYAEASRNDRAPPAAKVHLLVAVRQPIDVARRRHLRGIQARMQALFAYDLQSGDAHERAGLLRLAAIARFNGNLIGIRYADPFVVKETMQVDDIVSMLPPSVGCQNY